MRRTQLKTYAILDRSIRNKKRKHKKLLRESKSQIRNIRKKAGISILKGKDNVETTIILQIESELAQQKTSNRRNDTVNNL